MKTCLKQKKKYLDRMNRHDAVTHNYEVCAFPGCGKLRPTYSFSLTTPKFCATHKQPKMMKNTAKTRAILTEALTYFYHNAPLYFEKMEKEKVKKEVEVEDMDWQPTFNSTKRKLRFYDLSALIQEK